MEYYQDIYHHGILGMHWGIRRFQNSDGSLTAAGRDRYGVSKQEVRDAANKAVSTNKGAYDRALEIGVGKDGNGSILLNTANSAMDEYKKMYKSVQLNPEDKKAIDRKLHEEFGSGCDDEEYWNLAVEEHIEEFLNDSAKKNQTLQNKLKKYNDAQEEYWDNVHKIFDDVEAKYGKVKINDDALKNTGNWIIGDIKSELLDASFNSYLFRHFDDYWNMDLDERYDAIDRLSSQFSMEEYNRKYG